MMTMTVAERTPQLSLGTRYSSPNNGHRVVVEGIQFCSWLEFYSAHRLSAPPRYLLSEAR